VVLPFGVQRRDHPIERICARVLNDRSLWNP
jgi:hypothetical protein